MKKNIKNIWLKHIFKRNIIQPKKGSKNVFQRHFDHTYIL